MSAPEVPMEITVDAASRLLANPAGGALLLDVREADELAVCRVPGSQHLPMGEIPARLAELPRDRHILVLCHHGGRSLRVTRFLRQNGWGNVTNVAGGIDAWAQFVDPSLVRY